MLAGAALATLAGLVWGGAESLGIPVGIVVLLVMIAMVAMSAGALW